MTIALTGRIEQSLNRGDISIHAVRIETAPGGFIARFSMRPSADLPQRCFAVFDRHRVSPKLLSIFLDRKDKERLAITLKTQPCRRADLIDAVTELMRADDG